MYQPITTEARAMETCDISFVGYLSTKVGICRQMRLVTAPVHDRDEAIRRAELVLARRQSS